MAKEIKNKKGVSAKTMVEVGAGVAALGAATYLLFGPKGKQNRKAIKGWAVKMKGEIIEEFEKAKNLTEPVYHDIVNKIQAKYSKIKNVDSAELQTLITEIKKHWKAIEKEAKGKAKNRK